MPGTKEKEGRGGAEDEEIKELAEEEKQNERK
jgi:hypothetical protein